MSIIETKRPSPADDGWRRSIYASREFQAEIARILGVEPERSCKAIEALLESGIIPRLNDSASVASAKDAAFLLAACSSSADDPKAVVSMARMAISMVFQCDYGNAATPDRRGARTSTEPSEKDLFGTQLSAVLRRIGGRAEDGPSASDIGHEVGITIGWNGEVHSTGGLHFGLSDGDVSFLYADHPLFVELHPGVTLTRLNFGFESRFDVPPDALCRFGRVMRDLEDVVQDMQAAADAEYATFLMRKAMRREGWGIFDAGNGRQAIQKLDADAAGRFRTDQEAVDHVRSMAAIVSPAHRQALRLNYTEVHIDGEYLSPRPQPGR